MGLKQIITTALMMVSLASFAQQDSTAFRAYIYNNEYNVYMRINLNEKDIIIPGQELYGQLPGYLGKRNNSFCWVVIRSKMLSDKVAELQMVNDFGSEDLTATLTYVTDSVYVLHQVEGSTIKVPEKGKWRKLPKRLIFKKK